jgi:hypothetical protein
VGESEYSVIAHVVLNSSTNVEVWHRLPGAPLRNGVKCCNHEGHFDSGRVAGCPPPPCSPFFVLVAR